MKRHESETNIFYINEDESFGYPQTGFHNPSVSPNDKWVTYHRSYEIDWREAKFEDFIFHDVPDTMWRKIYYSKVGQHEKNLVPYPKMQKGGHIKYVGGREIWSPDGRYFVYYAKIENDNSPEENRIVVIDFGANPPKLVESVKCTSHPDVYFIGNESYTYADEYHEWLLKKRIGDPPQRILKFKNRISQFQIGSNGNVVYRCGPDEIYLDNLLKPLASSRRLGVYYLYTLSPGGKYVVLYTNTFYTKVKGRTADELAVLVDLEKEEPIYKFIVEQSSPISWSADGKKIAFVGEDILKFEKRNIPVANSYHHLVVVDIETMDIRIYLDNDSNHIIWFPDSKRILYQQGSEFHFLIRNIETNAVEGIVDNVREQGLRMTPSGKTIYWESSLAIGEYCFFIIQNPFYLKN